VGSKGTHLTLQREMNALHPVPSSQNPYVPGEPITLPNPQIDPSYQGDCNTGTTFAGAP